MSRLSGFGEDGNEERSFSRVGEAGENAEKGGSRGDVGPGGDVGNDKGSDFERKTEIPRNQKSLRKGLRETYLAFFLLPDSLTSRD